MRALTVDDSSGARLHGAQALSELGFQVFAASSGPEALALLERIGPVDVVLLDWEMPDMTGLEVLKRLRADPRYRDMIVVMATSLADPDHLSQALEAGANEYVMKPYLRDDVAEKLRMLGWAFAGDPA